MVLQAGLVQPVDLLQCEKHRNLLRELMKQMGVVGPHVFRRFLEGWVLDWNRCTIIPQSQNEGLDFGQFGIRRARDLFL